MTAINGLFDDLPYDPIKEKQNNEKVRADHMSANFDRTEFYMDNQLDRYGKKIMQANLKMNNKLINNLAPGVSSTDATTLGQVNNIIVNRQPSTESTAMLELATDDEAFLGHDNTRAITPSTLNRVIDLKIINSQFHLPYGYFNGFGITKDTENNLKVKIEYGSTRDSTENKDIIFNEGEIFIKSLDQHWQEGRNNGGLADNLTIAANTTYYTFTLATNSVPATNGHFETTNIQENIDNFKNVDDGKLKVVIDGNSYDLTDLSFTHIETINDIALVLYNKISILAMCTVENSSIIVTSRTTGATSTVDLQELAGVAGTNIAGVSYLNTQAGISVPGEPFVNSKIDFGFDTEISASNLMSSQAVMDEGFIFFKRIGVIITGDSAIIIDACYENGNKLNTNMYNINPLGIYYLQKLVTPNYNIEMAVTLNEPAEYNGVIKLYGTFNNIAVRTVYIDGVSVIETSGYDENSHARSLARCYMAPILKGQIVTRSGPNDGTLCLHPYYDQ